MSKGVAPIIGLGGPKGYTEDKTQVCADAGTQVTPLNSRGNAFVNYIISNIQRSTSGPFNKTRKRESSQNKLFQGKKLANEEIFVGKKNEKFPNIQIQTQRNRKVAHRPNFTNSNLRKILNFIVSGCAEAKSFPKRKK